MGITLQLEQNTRVIRYRITDPWTIGELTALYVQEHEFREQHPCVLHTLMDVSGVKTIAQDIFRSRYDAPALLHPRAGNVAVIGAYPLLKLLSETSFKIAGFHRVKFFNTEIEAWGYLRRLMLEASA